ncbi:alpha/beta-hydrolase [Tothia fuscella]|uniref:Carboxylic ester hydrolase n=1 Tax=Tothia fuscella TaxID=1048955 RepID=A0A9P4TYQ1_9PEZI|nr:alpha/beta-hydrolase [Tothia fuscella]
MARSILGLFLLLLPVFGQTWSPTGKRIPPPNILTSSGEVTGFIDQTVAPNVGQYLGIPYAEDPVGPLRFAPPVPKSPVVDGFNATKFGPTCSQYNSSVPSFFSVGDPRYSPTGQTSEACLSLNIWIPSKATGHLEGLLPVIIFFHGGGFTGGGSNAAYYNPVRWVARSQDHLVVTVNYRLNIFGFPNARNLNSPSSNLGFLDHRLAVEWIRDNIASFGGDFSRMTLFGQSAGAIAADAYNLAYPDDPIISGLILNSGTALLDVFSSDTAHSNFTFVAEKLGCGNATESAELECMRDIPVEKIENFLKEYEDSGRKPALSFLPVQDDITLFRDPAARARQGKLSSKPAIIGSTYNEGASLVGPYSIQGPTKDAMQGTNLAILCSAVNTTAYRYANNLTTFSYLYDGNFSNISPLPWLGAYHSSELPLIFGVLESPQGNSSVFEIDVAHRLQDLYVAFAADPSSLPSLGWPEYSPSGSAIVLGRGNRISSLTSVTNIYNGCSQ